MWGCRQFNNAAAPINATQQICQRDPDRGDVQFPLSRAQRTQLGHRGMSERCQFRKVGGRNVNTPPAKAGGFRLRLKAGLVRPLADSDGGCASSYLEIIVRFGRCLVLDIFGPYLIGDVSAARETNSEEST